MSKLRLRAIDSVGSQETQLTTPPAASNRPLSSYIGYTGGYAPASASHTNGAYTSAGYASGKRPTRLPATQLIGAQQATNLGPAARSLWNYAPHLARDRDPPAPLAINSAANNSARLTCAHKLEINNNNSSSSNSASSPSGGGSPIASMNAAALAHHNNQQQQRKLADRNHSNAGSTGTGETAVTIESGDTLHSGPKTPLLGAQSAPGNQIKQQQQQQHLNNLSAMATQNGPIAAGKTSGAADSRRAPLRKQEAADLEAQAAALRQHHAAGKHFAGLGYAPDAKRGALKLSHEYIAESASGADININTDDDDDELDEDMDGSQTDASSRSGDAINVAGHERFPSKQSGGAGAAAGGNNKLARAAALNNSARKSAGPGSAARQQQAAGQNGARQARHAQSQGSHNNRISFNENMRAPSYTTTTTGGGGGGKSADRHNNNQAERNSSNRKMDWLEHSGGYNSYDSSGKRSKHEHKIAMIDGSYSSGGSFYHPQQAGKGSKSQKAYMCLKSIVLLLLTMLLIMILGGMVLAGHYLPKVMNDLLAAPRTFNVTIAG